LLQVLCVYPYTCPFDGPIGFLQDNSGDDTYSIFLQNAETVALITPDTGKPIMFKFKIVGP